MFKLGVRTVTPTGLQGVHELLCWPSWWLAMSEGCGGAQKGSLWKARTEEERQGLAWQTLG